MSEIDGSEPRPEVVPSGGESEAEGMQRRDLGGGKLLGIVVFGLLIDVLVGIAGYYISCGKECKDRFSGVTGNDFADSLYFSSTTLTTTGFGDIAPTAPISKAFTAVYIACNTFYINYLVYPQFVRLVQTVEGRNRRSGRRFLLAIFYCLICLLSAIPFLICLGGLGWGNAAYTVVVSFSSTGYGDYTFTKMWGRVFNSLWLLVSHLVNYRLGGLVTDAGNGLFVQENDEARDNAVTTAADLAVVEPGRDPAEADVAVIKQERDAAVAAVAVVEQERDAAIVDRDLARGQLCTHFLLAGSQVQFLERQKNAAVDGEKKAREDVCLNVVRAVRATAYARSADARRVAAEERANQLEEGIGAVVVLMLHDAYFQAAVLEDEKVELGARLKATEYDLSRLQNPT